MMAVTKTDDARLIALYGEKMHPPVYKMPAEAVILMKQKKVVLRQLKKQLTSLANLKGSFTVLPRTDKNSLKTLDKTIAFIQKQIVGLEADIVNIANEEFSKQIRSLTSVKGIGVTLATSPIISTAGFTLFEHAKQLSRSIRICPTYQQSGKSINIKGAINRNGDSDLRSLLYISSCGMWIEDASGIHSENAEEAQKFFTQLQKRRDDPKKKTKKLRKRLQSQSKRRKSPVLEKLPWPHF